MPIIRYTCLVGSLLLGMLFLLVDRDMPALPTVPDRWTSVDSLRAMAHLGEAVRGQDRDTRFARIEKAPPETARRGDPAEVAVRANSLMMNAQASVDLGKTASPPAARKPRKQKIANRQVRVRTAIAENAPRMPIETFRPPSW